jgi:hypothetical protein
LNQAWSDATAEFSTAVAALTRPHIGTMSQADYSALIARAEAARVTSENARVAMQMHRKEHGC